MEDACLRIASGTVSKLGYWNVHANSGNGALQVCNLSVTASGQLSDASMPSVSDAGIVDAAPVDHSSDAQSASADGGAPTRSSGCGCDLGGVPLRSDGTVILLLGAAAVVIWSRRGQRGARRPPTAPTAAVTEECTLVIFRP